MRIVPLDHANLRQPAHVVASWEVGNIVKAMWEVMYDSKGVGLAAPQVGLSMQIAVIDCEGWKDVLLNPRVIKREGHRVCHEGCLSLPNARYAVRRAKSITVEYIGLDGQEHSVRARKSVLAQCLEHETDHLRGVLIDGGKPVEGAL
mgnify:CR=1 FL=1